MIGLTFLRHRARGRIRQEADAARDEKQYLKAATLYGIVLSRTPNNGPLHVQCGHMFKEAGILDRAEYYYEEAGKLMPDDPDLALQLGHFYKITGRLDQAEASYLKANKLTPDNPEITLQLAHLYKMIGRFDEAELYFQKAIDLVPDWPEPTAELAFLSGSIRPSLLMLNPRQVTPLPELAPSDPVSLRLLQKAGLEICQLGRRQRTAWGTHTTLRGVEAIRGFCISASPVIELCMRLNEMAFHTEGPLNGYPLKHQGEDPDTQKYVFNVWYDFTAFRTGRYWMVMHFTCVDGTVHEFRDVIVIGDPLSSSAYPNSDRLVNVSSKDNCHLDLKINSQPSVIRKARRAVLASPPRNVLIVRADQLGDIVTSIPAIERLRELLPGARFVGLLSSANCQLAETLDLFDEVVLAEGYFEDGGQQRRVMSADDQQKLQHRLSQFKFDMAIDLSVEGSSRPLLALSGAPYLLGCNDGRAPWLSASIGFEARDPISGFCELSHSGQVAALVEYLGVLLGNRTRTIRRNDLDRVQLIAYGVKTNDRFAVLHTGARLKFSQWPHYDTLASTILSETDLKVVMMTDDPTKRASLPRQLATSGRFRLLDERLPFDDFDALLSFCTVFVGNDSGPSHLASLRGAPVINLFMARHAWNEWGHENEGYIISRRVPCAGCNIHYAPEECGKDFACIANISSEEVVETIRKLI